MKTAIFSTKPYDETFLRAANEDFQAGHEFEFFEVRLSPRTAELVTDHPAICTFVNDPLDAHTLDILHQRGVRSIALRCAGYNQIDLPQASSLGLRVARVPAYSPFAVAEFALALILALNRKTHRAYTRTRDGNFSIDGLMGFDLNGKTIGIIGTGKIGAIFAQLLSGFGLTVLGYDPQNNPDFVKAGGNYVALDELFRRADIVSLHCPLIPQTYHTINADSLQMAKPGVMIINTSRGALVDAPAVIDALKSGRIGALGLDVYEQEANFFYEDLSDSIIQDDTLQRLISFPNVLVTSHQAYFTDTAMRNIAETTISNLTAFELGQPLDTELTTFTL